MATRCTVTIPLSLLKLTFFLWIKVTGFISIKSYASRAHWPFPTTSLGQIVDEDEWITWSSNSLMEVYNQSLLEIMMLGSIEQVHTHTRFAVLSHGIQDDPIFCYCNVATRNEFQYTKDEFYQLPSRYSAPGGGDRERRQKIMEDANNSNMWIIPTGIRLRKDGSLFEFRDLILWNVYNPQGVRVGQSAVYDRDAVTNVSISTT